MSEDAGIEPRTVATSALVVRRRSNYSAWSHPSLLYFPIWSVGSYFLSTRVSDPDPLVADSSARIYRPSFRENKPKTLVSATQNEHIGLVFPKTRSINSGTDIFEPAPVPKYLRRAILFCFTVTLSLLSRTYGVSIFIDYCTALATQRKVEGEERDTELINRTRSAAVQPRARRVVLIRAPPPPSTHSPQQDYSQFLAASAKIQDGLHLGACECCSWIWTAIVIMYEFSVQW